MERTDRHTHRRAIKFQGARLGPDWRQTRAITPELAPVCLYSVCVSQWKESARWMASTTSDNGDTSSKQPKMQQQEARLTSRSLSSLEKKKKCACAWTQQEQEAVQVNHCCLERKTKTRHDTVCLFQGPIRDTSTLCRWQWDPGPVRKEKKERKKEDRGQVMLRQ